MSFKFHRLSLITIPALICCGMWSCKKTGTATAAFYYWKSNFALNAGQAGILQQAGNNTLYLRFFDVQWDDAAHRPYPDAIIHFTQPVNRLTVIPVIYITNKTFEKIDLNAVDSLAIHCDRMVGQVADKNKIKFQKIQIDCDWTNGTREKYFRFLTIFKKIDGRQLAATIRLHQVKYSRTTGIPPADKGVLMFYNMGQLNADARQPNSIYNEADAARYVSYAARYPMPLDVALPLFSWAIHIREGRVVQVYGNIGRKELSNTSNFEQTGNSYIAKKSFFLNGIYIRESDIFKLEETGAGNLTTAADQLASHLPLLKNRTIIYYELANINLSQFNAQTIRQVSARF